MDGLLSLSLTEGTGFDALVPGLDQGHRARWERVPSDCYDNADRLLSSTDTAVGTPVYDSHGNTTTLGTQTLIYDGAQRHMETKLNGTTVVRYQRGITSRVEATTTTRYGFTGPGDSPSFVMDGANTVIERSIGLIGGEGHQPGRAAGSGRRVELPQRPRRRHGHGRPPLTATPCRSSRPVRDPALAPLAQHDRCRRARPHSRRLARLPAARRTPAISRLAHTLAHGLGPHSATALAISPGFTRTEAILATLGDDIPSGTDSIEFPGRAVRALLEDPHVRRHAGRTIPVADPATEWSMCGTIQPPTAEAVARVLVGRTGSLVDVALATMARVSDKPVLKVDTVEAWEAWLSDDADPRREASVAQDGIEMPGNHLRGGAR